jgi:hypothetical protein
MHTVAREIGGKLMLRFASALLWGAALLTLCTGQRATGQPGQKVQSDPEVIIAGDGDLTGAFPLGSSFSILSPTGTSPLHLLGGSPCEVLGIELPLCLFSNGTDFTWSTLTFSISPAVQPLGFTCLALAYFSRCQFSDHNQKVTFSGGSGLAAGDVFLFAVVGWAPNTTFAGKAFAPESSSRILERPLLPRTPARGPQSSSAEIFRDGQIALANHYRLRLETDFGA